MDSILGLIDFVRVNAEALAICIAFPAFLAWISRGDGPSCGGSASHDSDGDGGGD